MASDFSTYGLRKYLSAQQLADVLDVEPKEIRALIAEGLPVESVGRESWIPTAEAMRWLARDTGSWRDRWR